MVAWRICGSGVTCCLRVFWGLVRAGGADYGQRHHRDFVNHSGD